MEELCQTFGVVRDIKDLSLVEKELIDAAALEYKGGTCCFCCYDSAVKVRQDEEILGVITSSNYWQPTCEDAHYLSYCSPIMAEREKYKKEI